MLTVDAPVERSNVPLPSVANELTTQVVRKPLTGTGGPKKQVGSKAQAPRNPAQSASLEHDCEGLFDAVLGRLRTRGAVGAAGAEAGHQVHVVGRLEDRRGVLRDERRRLAGAPSADVQM